MRRIRGRAEPGMRTGPEPAEVPGPTAAFRRMARCGEPLEQELRNGSDRECMLARRDSTAQVSGAAHLVFTLRRHSSGMDVTRGLRIPTYDLGCDGAGATTIERELAATDGVLRVCVDGGWTAQ
jgi:hypothetical protein